MGDLYKEELKLPRISDPVIFDSPEDHNLPHRDQLRLFQEKYRTFLKKTTEEELSVLEERRKIKQTLKQVTPFRLSVDRKVFKLDINGHERTNRCEDMAKPDNVNTIKYWSKKYKRLSSLNGLNPTNCELPSLTSQTRLRDNHSFRSGNNGQLHVNKCSKISNDSVFNNATSPERPESSDSEIYQLEEINMRLSHNDYGSSSRVTSEQTLADMLHKYGYADTALCSRNLNTSESNQILNATLNSDKYVLSKIDSSVIDTSIYDDFARSPNRINSVRFPNSTPRTNDYSISRSEFGKCFPVFTGDGRPMRKFGSVHTLK